MADRMAAEIWIGGKLSRSLLDEFPISDLRLDWDETPIASTSEDGILSARDENGLLHFADCEAAWGEFEELEGWLREHSIPFQRQTSGKYEYDPCFVEFRPDLPRKPDRYTLTTQNGGSGHLPRRDREGHARHGEAGERQETHSGKTPAGVGEDLPQTEPIHALEAAAFTGL